MKVLQILFIMAFSARCFAAAERPETRDASQLEPVPGVAFFKLSGTVFELPAKVSRLSGLAVVDRLGKISGAASIRGSNVRIGSRSRGGQLLRVEWAADANPPKDGRLVFFAEPSGNLKLTNDFQRPGHYQVELLGEAPNGAEARVEIGGVVFSGPVTKTASGSATVSVIGMVRIPAAGKSPVLLDLTGAGAHFHALTLRPVAEGNPVKQQPNGMILLHSRDVTSRGIKLQYEPKPEKTTAGYWVNPSDTLSWDFEAVRGGRFMIEVLQGCGKGQGGSEVEVRVLDSIDGPPLFTSRFTVQDTGHFQNFVPQEIGSVQLPRRGMYRLVVLPVKKAGVAVMDVRQITLQPR